MRGYAPHRHLPLERPCSERPSAGCRLRRASAPTITGRMLTQHLGHLAPVVRLTLGDAEIRKGRYSFYWFHCGTSSLVWLAAFRLLALAIELASFALGSQPDFAGAPIGDKKGGGIPAGRRRSR